MIVLDNWSIQNVLGNICLTGRVLEDSSGRYRKFNHIVSKPLTKVFFDSGIAMTEEQDYKLFGAMR